jgi:hypothetical protein
MPAALQKSSPDQKLHPSRQQFVKCTYCDQRFVLTWDDSEWNCVASWLRVAGVVVRKSHPGHPDTLQLSPTVNVNIFG